ncbi:MAG: lipid droplet-associated protein [Geodermatophilaceae bacterium]|nr:lipid droplet-associated protein [Geodermatophilaceae bacterium]
MSSALPPSVRAIAGLAARTLDEARRLPTRLISLPVVTAGAAMQASLRLQQEYAGLIARGDELILALRGSRDEPPPWATFDDGTSAEPTAAAADAEPAQRRGAVAPLLSAGGAGGAGGSEPSAFDLVDDSAAGPTAPVAGYEGWTVAQLRARLRRLSTEELALLLAYEQDGRQRAPYIRMLQNRLTATSKG